MHLVKSPDEPIVQELVKNAIIASVPERETELRSMWDTNKDNLCFQIYHERSDILLDAGAYKFIRFTPKTARLFWLGSFIAWEGYRKIEESRANHTNPDLKIFRLLLSEFDRLYDCDDVDNVAMPIGIPAPETFPCSSDEIEVQAAAKISIISLSWAFLHEIKHIKHQQAGTSAPNDDSDASRKEELSCDEFATKFIFEKINKIPNASPKEKESMIKLRETSIYFSIFTMLLISKGHWDKTESHPSMQERIKNITNTIDSINTTRNEDALEIGQMAIAALGYVFNNPPKLI